MEPKNSSLQVQKPVICPYPEPDQSGPWPHTVFLKIHFSIILPSTHMFRN